MLPRTPSQLVPGGRAALAGVSVGVCSYAYGFGYGYVFSFTGS